MARLTGLSEDYIENSNLRVEMQHFAKELLREERRTVGRFDSRYKGIDPEAAGETPDYDPSYAAVQGAYTAALNRHVRENLKFKSDLPYEILTGNVHPWNYSDFENRYVRVSDSLREAMTQNQFLQVLVANGYYDLATPAVATEYTFDHLALPEELRDHVKMTYYPAGHMMYTHKPSLEALSRDIRKFYEETLSD
jgi:carboxypeptidase C (cathepsin A)